MSAEYFINGGIGNGNGLSEIFSEGVGMVGRVFLAPMSIM